MSAARGSSPACVGRTWRKWVLPAAEVESRREAARSAARGALDAEPGGAQPAPQSAAAPGPLDAEEEARLRLYWERKLQEVCAAFKFPTKVMACAVTYFKRFYLSHSMLDYTPKHIMLTCIYLACKVEENHVRASEFGKGLNEENAMTVVLKHELVVLEALRFELVVFTPFRAIRAALEAAGGGGGSAEVRDEALRVAKQRAWRAMVTDAVLNHPPAVVAVACARYGVHAAAGGAAEEIVGAMVESIASTSDFPGGTAALTAAIDACDALIDVQDVSLDNDDIRELERRRKAHRNPRFNPDSEQYKAEAAAKEEMRKRAKKAKQASSRRFEAEFQDVQPSGAEAPQQLPQGAPRPLDMTTEELEANFIKRRKSDDGRAVRC